MHRPDYPKLGERLTSVYAREWPIAWRNIDDDGASSKWIKP